MDEYNYKVKVITYNQLKLINLKICNFFFVSVYLFFLYIIIAKFKYKKI